ncbi:Replication factor C subunit 2 [Carpediemonas membranifera]|uniref:Replication factor C subunit 2 n=1 Tax=Carpediemonas membranifera TaxID=201153 RepID=A0A8J6BBZ3_9EUKA|nr:Replication factor C subunit 2 [Carpediemonas membranifera]|eukprot:KAG9394212.1 Replication factor C subunit 2 [Carpediemonas membranifera]
MATTTKKLPWVEKYRPRLLKDVVGNEEAVSRLSVIAKSGVLPHMILSGPPGVGKTTSVHCLANELLGKELSKKAVLELNASDDRGIEVVRTSIKTFAQKKVTLPPNRQKIIILDEADSMTAAAQQALRRTMENFSGTTRFMLACNQPDKIIEPIQSRCAIVRFTKLTDSQVKARLVTVAAKESVPLTQDGIDALTFIADGDMRQAMCGMEATFAGKGDVTADNVYQVCDTPSPEQVKQMVAMASKGDFDGASGILMKLHGEGFAVTDLLSTVYRAVCYGELPEGMRMNFMRVVAETHLRVSQGSDTILQLSGMVGAMCMAAHSG